MAPLLQRLVVVSLVSLASLVSSARAEGVRVARGKAGQIRVDGDVGEWRALRAQRVGDDEGAASEWRLVYDETGLYVAAVVQDDAFVRTAAPSPREDALVLSLALPDAGRWRVSELWLFAGQVGRTRAAIMLAQGPGGRPHPLGAGAQIVEGAAEGGYVVEAFVPWRLLPGGDDHEHARATLRMHDVDRAGAAPVSTSSSSEQKPERWPWLELDGGVTLALKGFLQAKNLASASAKLDWVGDLRGDARAERLLVIGTFLVQTGEAGRFSFDDLPVTTAADVRSSQMLDITGDGKPELVVSLRQKNELGARELWQAFDLQGERARPFFAIETRKETAAGFVSTAVDVKNARGGKPEITVALGRAEGLSPDNYAESAAVQAEAILLPWGPVSERVYAWDGARFAVVRERKNPNAVAPASHERTETSAEASRPRVETVVHPEPPGADALIAAYRSARGLADDAAPRFVQHANLAEDRRIETLASYGTELVVVGDGFRGGVGFFYFGLPVKAPADVQRVFTGDVTGDGRREIFVRIRQMIGDVQREILLGYTFAGEALTPILSVEVRRARGADSVGNVVALVRDGRHFALRITPGFAHGWGEASYPFTTESLDGIGPLLLPWRDSPVKYRFDGQALVGAQGASPR